MSEGRKAHRGDSMLAIIEGLLPQADLARASELADRLGEPLDAVCTRLGLCSEDQIAEALCSSIGVLRLYARDLTRPPAAVDVLNAMFLQARRAYPIVYNEEAIQVAMVDPTDRKAIEGIEFATERCVVPLVCSATDMAAAWGRWDAQPLAEAQRSDVHLNQDVERLTDMASDAPVVRYVNHVVARAIDLRASDIHLEPVDRSFRIRFRLDGMLRLIEEQPAPFGEAVVSRLKIMAHLDIAERRLAQDGRFRVSVRGQEVDLRMATAPTVHGEAVVLRILDSERVPLDLHGLGFSTGLIDQWNRMLDRPHGILLVTGPTGSGKSTTLYASLTKLNCVDRKLLTIEDPVEQQLMGVNQVHAQPAIGFGFSAALRSFLRHDPDVIMVGEIRDQETARTAIQAALTGHLILSTLHTNDAVSGITRLLDMGVDDYLICSTVVGILGQRLVRCRCQTCGGPFTTAEDCSTCGGIGYSGRTTIGELMSMTSGMRFLIERRAGYDQLRAQAVADGMIPLAIDGSAKVAAGVTTPEEVARATLDS